MRYLIFGNSGSGKSTLAKQLSHAHNLSHLDLDTIAWGPTVPPKRKPLAQSEKMIQEFIRQNSSWVIEGCYTDLLQLAAPAASEIIFMNLPIDDCVTNAKNRPWEPHKYASKEAQDANLGMLVDWINMYESRQDTFSYAAHRQFFEEYSGKKKMYLSNNRGRL